MPIYEYQCRKCGAHTEILQKVTDKPLTKCRKCKGRLEKQWSNTSFQFKGSGWYVTDYAGKKSDAGEEKKTAESESATTREKTVPKEKTDAKKKTSETKTASPGSSASGD